MTTVRWGDERPATPGQVAYACAQLGWRVFPLRTDTGTPALLEWPVRATTDLAQLRTWWGGQYAHHPVGILTGEPSGIWVLDVDVKPSRGAGGAFYGPPVDGLASLRDLAAAHDEPAATFCETFTVATKSGGLHLYWRWDDAAASEGGIVNSAGRLGPGLDVRGRGGNVRAPHGAYRVVRSCEPVAAPAWLCALAKRRRSGSWEPYTNADVRDLELRRRRGGSWARFRAAEAVRSVRIAGPGTRNDALNRAAYQLGALFAAYGTVDAGSSRAALLAAMREAGARDGLDVQERTFQSGWDSGVAAAGARDDDTASADIEQFGDDVKEPTR